MPRYRKRPIEVEAEQWFPGKNIPGVNFQPHAYKKNVSSDPYVTTIQGRYIAIKAGEWVIQEGDGVHAHPCDPTVFERTYEPCSDASEPSSPDLAVRIVVAVEANLKDRRGISWDNLGDDDLIQSMRDELARVVRDVLAEPAKE